MGIDRLKTLTMATALAAVSYQHTTVNATGQEKEIKPIVFSCEDSNDPRRMADVCMVDLKGGKITNLTNTRDIAEVSPSLSPDGTEIAFFGMDMNADPQYKKWVLYRQKIDGGTPIEITSELSVAGPTKWVEKGPFENKILFLGEHKIYAIDPDGKNLQVTADFGNTQLRDLKVSPDGNTIIVKINGFYSFLDYKLMVNTKNGEFKTFLPVNTTVLSDVAFSPDSKKVAFIAKEIISEAIHSTSGYMPRFKPGSEPTLSIYDFDKGEIVGEPAVSGLISSIEWSPDGKDIAYYDSYNNIIYTYSMDDKKKNIVTYSNSWKSGVMWGSDGKIYYTNIDNKGNNLAFYRISPDGSNRELLSVNGTGK